MRRPSAAEIGRGLGKGLPDDEGGGDAEPAGTRLALMGAHRAYM